MAKENFVVTHGSVKTPEGIIPLYGVALLEPDDVKKMDPTGVVFMPQKLWDAKQKGAAAAAKAEAEALAEVKPVEVKPAPAAKAGGK